MIKIPEKMSLANLPTKVERLGRFSQGLGNTNIYIKRDDQTGLEFSGNKIRKLEFSVQEAINQRCDTLITCGGIQSNHCRATAAVAAKLGLKACLVLRGSKEAENDGNLLLDRLLGADIRFISADDYKNKRLKIMNDIKEELQDKGLKPYIIPEGASNGIGSFGYYNTMEEIMIQEQEIGITFDAIVVAVGSGGTYSGLLLANKMLNHKGQIYGFNVCDNAEHFKNQIYKIFNESLDYLNVNIKLSKDEINIIDGYVGRGYALSRPEELCFIHEFAKSEGIILDPVYTGKAMYGLRNEINKGSFKDCKNILFIHTGGLFGLFPQRNLFEF